MSEPEVEIALPSASRAGWIFVLLVGIALAVVAGIEVAQLWHFRPRPVDVLGLGAGIFLAAFSITVQLVRPLPAKLRVSDEALRIACRNGESATVPLSILDGVDLIDGGSGGNTEVLALRKKDGGFIELCALRSEDRARAIAEPIREALARYHTDADDECGEVAAQGDAHERLVDVRSVSVARFDGRLELGWRARPVGKSLAALGPLVGMAIIVYGFHLHDGGTGTRIAMAITALLAVLLVAAILLNLGLRQRVTIDDERVAAERLRGKRVTSKQDVPLDAVVAVDCTQQLSVLGTGITFRTAAAVEQNNSDGSDARERSAGDVAGPVMKLLSHGVHVSCFDLSLPAKVALALAISDEIAARTEVNG